MFKISFLTNQNEIISYLLQSWPALQILYGIATAYNLTLFAIDFKTPKGIYCLLSAWYQKFQTAHQIELTEW